MPFMQELLWKQEYHDKTLLQAHLCLRGLALRLVNVNFFKD